MIMSTVYHQAYKDVSMYRVESIYTWQCGGLAYPTREMQGSLTQEYRWLLQEVPPSDATCR